MQGLKILVTVMSVLIFLGLGLLGYGVYQKSAAPDTALATPETPPPFKGRHNGWEPSKPFGDKDIALPSGCQVENIIPTRGRRLFLQIGPKGPACERIIIINVSDGTVQGTLNIKSLSEPGP